MQSAGLNGIGRFGQHFLKHWLETSEASAISIEFIHDYSLSTEQAVKLMSTDSHLGTFFSENILGNTETTITFRLSSGEDHVVNYSHGKQIAWLGKPTLHLDASGKHTDSTSARKFITGKTQYVIISATAPTADKTLVYGFNHDEFSKDAHQIVSYGSCTVNAYICLANFINDNYSVKSSDVNVIHNTPDHLQSEELIVRKSCTLELAAPALLTFLKPENFAVNYTLVPFSGASMIDYRFEIAKAVTSQDVVSDLKNAVTSGALQNLYDIEPFNRGMKHYKFTQFSAIVLEESVRIVGNNLYFSAIFDNENSGTRYLDLVNSIARKI